MMLNQEISVYHFWEEVKRNNSKKRQLVECLLACSNIKDEGARTTLLNQLPSWVSNISSHSQLKIHVTQIVNTCLEYRGGIEQLVDILFFYEEDSNAARNLSEVLQELYPLPIAWAKVAKLKSLLNNVSEEKLLNIREACLAEDISLPPICYEGNVLTSLIDGLVRMGQLSTGKVPILEFVRRVTPYVNDSKALDTWINDVAKHQFRLIPDEIDQLGKDPVCHQPKSSYLLIKLDQADPNLDTYHVQAWFAKNQADEEPPVIYSSSEAKPLAELAQVVDNVLNSIVHKQFAITNRELTIEFFLPKELLCHPIDQWIIDPDIDETLGNHYRLVIRSSERFENDRLLNRLKGYWQVNINILQTSPKACMICLHQDEDKGVRGHLGKGKLFFTLKFVPSPQFLFKLIQFGVPFILWPRYLNRPEEIEDFDRLLSCSNCAKLEQLPEVLRQERLKIIDDKLDKQSMTYHLSLLWDVPDRIPKFKLVAPT